MSILVVARSDREERCRADRLPGDPPGQWPDRDPGPGQRRRQAGRRRLTITAVTQGSKGKVAITGGGTGLTYDPTGFSTGTDSFRYTIQDNQSRTNSATVFIVISKATPVAARPTLSIVGSGTLGSTSASVRVGWGTVDAGTGLKSYQVQESYNGGAFKAISLIRPTAGSAARKFTYGKSYRYRVKVTDTAGNVSPWAISPTFVVSRVQESTAGIVYSGAWVAASSTKYSLGKPGTPRRRARA